MYQLWQILVPARLPDDYMRIDYEQNKECDEIVIKLDKSMTDMIPAYTERMVVLMVTKACERDETFFDKTIEALREYADELENYHKNVYEGDSKFGSDLIEIETNNGCRVKVIAGAQSIE